MPEEHGRDGQEHREIGKIWEEFSKRNLSTEEQKLVNAFTEGSQEVFDGGSEARGCVAACRQDRRSQETHHQRDPSARCTVTTDVNALVKYQTEASEAGYKAAVSRYEAIRIIALIALALGAALGILLAVSIVRGIVRPLKGGRGYQHGGVVRRPHAQHRR